MSLILTKNSMPLEIPVGTASAQVICKVNIDVPDGKPDILRILAAKAEARVDASSIRIADGQVTATGVVRLDAPYVAVYERNGYGSDREPLRFFTTDEAEFRAELVVANIQPDMKAYVDAEVDSFEVDVANSRTVLLTAIVKVAARVVRQEAVDIIADTGDVGALVELTKRSVFIEKRMGFGTAQVTIKDAFQIPEGNPDISEILDYTASILMLQDAFRPSMNRVGAAGTLDLRIVYRGDAETDALVFLAGPQIDFTVSVEMPGVDEGTQVTGSGRITSLSLQKIGSRTLQVEAVVSVEAVGTAVAELGLITEAAAKDASAVVDYQRAPVRLQCLVGSVAVPKTVSDTFAISVGKPNIAEVLMSHAKARIIDARITPDKVSLFGEVDAYVTFAGVMEDETEPAMIDVAQQLGLPFDMSFDLTGVESGMDLVASCEVLEVDAAQAGPRAIDLDIKLSAVVKVTEDIEMDVVTDAAVVTTVAAGTAPSRRMTIYIVQQGDTMWKIARRYDKTMAAIAGVNSLALGEVHPGQKLLIPA